VINAVDCDIYYRERGPAGRFVIGIKGLTERSERQVTISVDGNRNISWQDRPLPLVEVEKLKSICGLLPVTGTPDSTIPDGQTYQLSISSQKLDASYEWWGELSGEWQVLNELVHFMRRLANI